MHSLFKLFNLCLSPDTTIVSLLIVLSSAIAVFMFICLIDYKFQRILGLFISFIPLVWSLYLWFLYDGSGHTFQLLCHIPFIHLSIGVDSVGLSLLLLTSFIMPICVMLCGTSTGVITFLLLELVIIGSLVVLDLLAFYVFFESSLILLFLVIARPHKPSAFNFTKHIPANYIQTEAAYRIVLYTMVGSIGFLPVIFILYSVYGSTNLFVLTCGSNALLSADLQVILGILMAAVFFVKIPLVPLAGWLPEAHVAAPTAGSVLLAGVLLKLGGIGIIRYLIPIFPVFVVKIFPFIAVMCIVSFLFSTLTTLRQVDLKKIVAYSSIAHMSLVTLAIFSLSEHSIASSTFMMVAHGLVSPALFLLVGFLYERSHTKYLPYLTGLGSHMPIYASLFFILTLANLSFPLFPNFIAEVLCLVSLFAVHSLYAYIFCISQVLGAVYGFWTFNRVMHGYNSNTFNIKTSVVDLSRREVSLILPLLIGIFWLGLKPMA